MSNVPTFNIISALEKSVRFNITVIDNSDSTCIRLSGFWEGRVCFSIVHFLYNLILYFATVFTWIFTKERGYNSYWKRS